MKVMPILFTAAMVRAILEGRKTQTRRVITKYRVTGVASNCTGPDGYDVATLRRRNKIERVPWDAESLKRLVCPYGQPGDRLWVRETFLLVGGDSPNDRVVYRASNNGPDAWVSPAWRPSIFMPRWASRILLGIVDVRVEKVQAISGEDAIAEGIQIPRCGCEVCAHSSGMCPADQSAAIMAYAELWDSINAKREDGKYAWAKNPFVWALEFRKI